MVTYDELTGWAGGGQVMRAEPEVVAGWRIPERMKVLLVEVGVPVAPRLIERVVIQREDHPVLQASRGPLYRLTEHVDLAVPAARSSFGVEPTSRRMARLASPTPLSICGFRLSTATAATSRPRNS
ncbi:SUKH-4 family immunity protein [Streptomyces sp. NPDC047009]|uniref:SUKH-4 family immunity protein n=1 Tax=unclassified Streptomyces TaxID=2593676 RepID=UPI00340ABD90